MVLCVSSTHRFRPKGFFFFEDTVLGRWIDLHCHTFRAPVVCPPPPHALLHLSNPNALFHPWIVSPGNPRHSPICRAATPSAADWNSGKGGKQRGSRSVLTHTCGHPTPKSVPSNAPNFYQTWPPSITEGLCVPCFRLKVIADSIQ